MELSSQGELMVFGLVSDPGLLLQLKLDIVRLTCTCVHICASVNIASGADSLELLQGDEHCVISPWTYGCRRYLSSLVLRLQQLFFNPVCVKFGLHQHDTETNNLALIKTYHCREYLTFKNFTVW